MANSLWINLLNMVLDSKNSRITKLTRCFLRTVKNVLYDVFGENECVGKGILKLLAKLFDEDAMRPRFAGGLLAQASVNLHMQVRLIM